MAVATNLGFPRIGLKRELKKATEAFWNGKSSEQELQNTAKELRLRHWKLQQDAGISHIPSNDFSFYDQVLDTTCMVGAVPERYGFKGGETDLSIYFAMARGEQTSNRDVTAMEMTKWFDTNYHYIVPEFSSKTEFSYASKKAVNEYKEAKEAGIHTRPVLVGPVTYLLSGKAVENGFNPLSLLDKLLPIYQQVIAELVEAGADWIQMDEAILVTDLPNAATEAFEKAYKVLGESEAQLLLTTYFEGLGDNTKLATSLPVDGLHIDLVRAPQQLDDVLSSLPKGKVLSLGVVDGRNIWKTDLKKAYQLVEKAAGQYGAENLFIAPSCSLLHSPVDLTAETKLDDEFKNWLAFATQKLSEITALTNAVNGKKDKVAFEDSAKAVESRKSSSRIHNQAVKQRFDSINAAMAKRQSGFDQRVKAQRSNLNLPLFPTTTIGSFPQTQDVRKARAAHKRGDMNDTEYNQFLKEKTQECVAYQDKIGLDMPVHGEFERNDMVEYFGELMEGYAFTKNGWVQSYGSRCVKPPIIFGDVHRPNAMTVEWSAYAQSLTENPMKGMLTGPVTMLQWAFVRDDQPRETTCKQIALALRDEVTDLESAGIRAIQIDEPALREGLPLRKNDQAAYLKWAIESFRLSASGVKDETQIHTHMCYAEFNDIIDSIGDMDADVISIETIRSNMELLAAFENYNYPNEIGPGVYDIHSPRTPNKDWMVGLLQKATKRLKAEQIWVNPDCGLKTRKWEEVEPALEAMVQAAKEVRNSLKKAA